MNSTSRKFSMSGNTRIIVAIISLVGVIAVAVISTWDKSSPTESTIQVTYSGYKPTGTFDTELRYYFDVSGTRAVITSMQTVLINTFRDKLISEYPDNAEEINSILDIANKEAPTLDEVLKKYRPVYRKYFTVEKIQELNKFYSTEIMLNMVKKTPFN